MKFFITYWDNWMMMWAMPHLFFTKYGRVQLPKGWSYHNVISLNSDSFNGKYFNYHKPDWYQPRTTKVDIFLV